MRDLTPSDFPFLASLAASDRSVDRSIWLRVATDHFVAARPDDPARRAAFAELMIAALAGAEETTWLEVARKLAPCPHTPRPLLDWLAARSPELDAFLLESAAAFPEADLRAAIRDPSRAAAVARRGNLSLALVAALIGCDDAKTLIALAENLSAPVEGDAFGRLARQARRRAATGDRRLADALLKRRPIPPEAAILFLEADPPARVEILLAVQRLQLGRPAGRLPAVDEAALERLESAAVGRRPDDFVTALAEALGCEDDLARRIVGDCSGEPLAVALSALGARNDALVRMLISNDLDAGGFRRIRALARLNAALNRSAAAAVIGFLRGDDGRPDAPQRQAAHRGHRAGAEPRRPDRAASPAPLAASSA